MNPLEQIKMCEEQFTRSEQRIESYVLANPDMVAAYPIVEIAEKWTSPNLPCCGSAKRLVTAVIPNSNTRFPNTFYPAKCRTVML